MKYKRRKTEGQILVGVVEFEGTKGKHAIISTNGINNKEINRNYIPENMLPGERLGLPQNKSHIKYLIRSGQRNLLYVPPYHQNQIRPSANI